MNPTPTIVRTVVEIDAPPDRVFEALTDARELAGWWGAGDARVLDSESDVRPGGTWRVRTIDRDGAEHTFGGEYRVVDPPHRLEQSWQSSEDAEPSLVRYDLEPLDVDGAPGTRLTVTHTESFDVNAICALALHASQPDESVRVQRNLQPAWFGTRHRVAWANRVHC
jgi:uncharacterized protein YndB with AHSA1/START domain